MADQKLSSLPIATSLSDADLVYLVVTPSTTPTSKGTPISTLKSFFGNSFAEYLSAGVVSVATYNDLGTGAVEVANVDVSLFNNAAGSGVAKKYSLPGLTFTLTDNVTNYIVADYNSGNPLIRVITDVAAINETTIIPIFSILRTGTVLHEQNWDRLGLALPNKIHQSIVKTQRYRRQNGLTISESGTRNLNLTAGTIWVGAVPVDLSAITTATDGIIFYYHVAGVWTPNYTFTQYNNSQYDNGTDLVTLSGAGTQYAVNWVFRGVESQKHLYIILGTGNYNLAQAQAATVPAIPNTISEHCVLVAKIIVAQAANTATSIQSAFDTQFSYASATSHGDLLNLTEDDHTQYLLLAGRTGEQVITDDVGITGTLRIGNGTDAKFTYSSAVAGAGGGGNYSALYISPLAANCTAGIILRPSGTATLLPAYSLSDSSTGATGSHNFLMGIGANSFSNYTTAYFASTIAGNVNANSFPIGFLVSNTTAGRFTAMTVNYTGNVGIGATATTPVNLLSVGDNGTLVNAAVFPVISMGANNNDIRCLQLKNSSAGVNAEMRFIAAANDNSYFAFTQPSSTNSSTAFFGVSKASASFIFNSSNGAATERDIIIGTIGAADLFLGTSNLRRLTILADGKIGINKLIPTQILDVVGNGAFTGTLSASNLSGTNTGDQDLSTLAPKNNPVFTGLITTPAIKITTGAALNKVLTSDADGLAHWADSTGGGGADNPITITYDDFGRVATIRDDVELVTTTMSYDVYDNLTSYTDGTNTWTLNYSATTGELINITKS